MWLTQPRHHKEVPPVTTTSRVARLGWHRLQGKGHSSPRSPAPAPPDNRVPMWRCAIMRLLPCGERLVILDVLGEVISSAASDAGTDERPNGFRQSIPPGVGHNSLPFYPQASPHLLPIIPHPGTEFPAPLKAIVKRAFALLCSGARANGSRNSSSHHHFTFATRPLQAILTYVRHGRGYLRRAHHHQPPYGSPPPPESEVGTFSIPYPPMVIRCYSSQLQGTTDIFGLTCHLNGSCPDKIKWKKVNSQMTPHCAPLVTGFDMVVLVVLVGALTYPPAVAEDGGQSLYGSQHHVLAVTLCCPA